MPPEYRRGVGLARASPPLGGELARRVPGPFVRGWPSSRAAAEPVARIPGRRET